MKYRRATYRKLILTLMMVLGTHSNPVDGIPSNRRMTLMRHSAYHALSVTRSKDKNEPNPQLQRRRKINKNPPLFAPPKVNTGNYDYGSEGNSWSYQKRVRCLPGDPTSNGTSDIDVVVTYEYAVETTTNKNLEQIRQNLEYEMLMVTVSELCGKRSIVGLYSSLPVDQPAGKRQKENGYRSPCDAAFFVSIKISFCQFYFSDLLCRVSGGNRRM